MGLDFAKAWPGALGPHVELDIAKNFLLTNCQFLHDGQMYR